ncbi:MAG TPA: ribosome maturation factor RimM [Synergistales bacterium]|jgi:16S rRNA processing protein RimM|nr:ribosome maturation factor RimM [Synergistales bacterium]HRV72141.1 ribosome maturation factor RimM [Thermovirgaceae bacterium]
MGEPQMTIIGRVLGAHGVRGEFRVLPLTDFPERFLDMECMDIFRPAGKLLASISVEGIRSHEGKGVFLVSSPQVRDRECAQSLEGGLVMIARSERVSLPEGSFWIDDVIGLEVLHADTGESFGNVLEVMKTGEHDIYVIQSGDGTTRMLPAVREAVLRIAPDEGFMEVRPPEGLWD